MAGPQYPAGIDWPANVERIEHLPPDRHPDFYAASRYTLNVTRADMVRAGWSPSVRLFEAGACGTPVISDRWDGLETLLVPEREILLPEGPEAVLSTLRTRSEAERRRLGQAARTAILARHTAAARAADLEHVLAEARTRRGAGRPAASDLAIIGH